MLIRFQIKNLFSFKDETEFNMLPGNVKRFPHHKYAISNIEVLKQTAIYGANASGKSNLIKAIYLLQNMLLTGKIPKQFTGQKFKLSEQCITQPTELAIEFEVNKIVYFYSVAVNNGIIAEEYFSKINEQQTESLIYHRTLKNNKVKIQFYDAFEKNSNELKTVIENDLIKQNQLLFTLLNGITNQAFDEVRIVYDWFKLKLRILFPSTMLNSIINSLDTHIGYKQYAEKYISALNTGIVKLKVEKHTVEDYYGKDNQELIDDIKSEIVENPDKKVLDNFVSDDGELISIVNENGKAYIKNLKFEQVDEQNKNVEFKYSELSDGTKRLTQLIPLWPGIVKFGCTFIIDEIERSIHPTLIKELVKGFSESTETNGQLIFSTHESNLLDQTIFRPDEIWFAEKNKGGATEFYTLNDFKEHSTIDIRKGYLSGRYGAIPFLGNLNDLSWKE